MTMRIGYASGVFDLFHIGHLNLLERASARCDRLIVGVAADDYVREAKGHVPVIPFRERAAIVGALHMVDEVVRDDSEDKVIAWLQHPFHVIFKGDDWTGTPKGHRLETAMRVLDVDVVYFPYTQRTSSTMLREFLATAGGR
jgi:glycerol-3-phosphate cytidylyltransferase